MESKTIRRISLIIFSVFFSTVLIFLFSSIARTPPKFNPNPSQNPAWPSEIVQVEYPTSADNTLQPALYYDPHLKEPAPLLVALHSWSGDYLQVLNAPAAEWCVEKGWVFIHPNFRGPNNKPEATGSDLVIQDILSAVEFAKNNSNVDPNRIYLVGASGGGYTALLVAARHPEPWAGVSVWVPITDLTAWYYQTQHLDREFMINLETTFGGAPGDSPEIDLAYKNRSPITYLSPSISIPIDINAGIHDGRIDTGSVPISHSLLAYNALVAPEFRLSEEAIQYFVEQGQVPNDLVDPLLSDPAYGEQVPLFRRRSEDVRITLFDGGHDIIFNAALLWLAGQQK